MPPIVQLINRDNCWHPLPFSLTFDFVLLTQLCHILTWLSGIHLKQQSPAIDLLREDQSQLIVGRDLNCANDANSCSRVCKYIEHWKRLNFHTIIYKEKSNLHFMIRWFTRQSSVTTVQLFLATVYIVLHAFLRIERRRYRSIHPFSTSQYRIICGNIGDNEQ